MDDDELTPIRSCYYIGDFSGLQKQAKNLKGLRGVRARERDSFLVRALLAQKKYSEAESFLKSSDPSATSTPLLSVRQQLRYRSSDSEAGRQSALDELSKFVSNSDLCKNTAFLTCACETLMLAENYSKCLELLQKHAEIADDSLELLLMQVSCLLLINRKDLAVKKLGLMQELDDDDACTAIAMVLVGLSSDDVISKESLSDCADKLEDLMAGLKETCVLVNLSAVVYMQRQDFRNAWRRLQKAKELSTKEGLSAVPMATLVNGIVCLQHLAKGQSTLPKLASDLAKNEPSNSFLSATAEMGALYDRCAASFDSHVKTLDS